MPDSSMNRTDAPPSAAPAQAQDKLRWGIIGLGQVARGRVVPAIQRRGAGTLLACAGRCPQATTQAAAELGIARVHADWQALLADPGIDAVYIATPNALHADVAVAALDQGKHVLCEKPMALALADAQRIVDAARRSGRIFRLALQIRREAVLQRAFQLMREGVIGDVRFMDIERLAPIGQAGTWRRERGQGGSILYDVGVHLLDLATWMGGADVETVDALAHPVRAPAGEDSITMLALLANGVQVTLRCSRELPYGRNSFSAMGTRGMLATGALRWAQQHVLTRQSQAGGHEEIHEVTDLYGEQAVLFAHDALCGSQYLPNEDDGLRLVRNALRVERALESAGRPRCC